MLVVSACLDLDFKLFSRLLKYFLNYNNDRGHHSTLHSIPLFSNISLIKIIFKANDNQCIYPSGYNPQIAVQYQFLHIC